MVTFDEPATDAAALAVDPTETDTTAAPEVVDVARIVEDADKLTIDAPDPPADARNCPIADTEIDAAASIGFPDAKSDTTVNTIEDAPCAFADALSFPDDDTATTDAPDIVAVERSVAVDDTTMAEFPSNFDVAVSVALAVMEILDAATIAPVARRFPEDVRAIDAAASIGVAPPTVGF